MENKLDNSKLIQNHHDLLQENQKIMFDQLESITLNFESVIEELSTQDIDSDIYRTLSFNLSSILFSLIPEDKKLLLYISKVDKFILFLSLTIQTFRNINNTIKSFHDDKKNYSKNRMKTTIKSILKFKIQKKRDENDQKIIDQNVIEFNIFSEYIYSLIELVILIFIIYIASLSYFNNDIITKFDKLIEPLDILSQKITNLMNKSIDKKSSINIIYEPDTVTIMMSTKHNKDDRYFYKTIIEEFKNVVQNSQKYSRNIDLLKYIEKLCHLRFDLEEKLFLRKTIKYFPIIKIINFQVEDIPEKKYPRNELIIQRIEYINNIQKLANQLRNDHRTVIVYTDYLNKLKKRS